MIITRIFIIFIGYIFINILLVIYLLPTVSIKYIPYSLKYNNYYLIIIVNISFLKILIIIDTLIIDNCRTAMVNKHMAFRTIPISGLMTIKNIIKEEI